jgi:hypothetical protein
MTVTTVGLPNESVAMTVTSENGCQITNETCSLHAGVVATSLYQAHCPPSLHNMKGTKTTSAASKGKAPMFNIVDATAASPSRATAPEDKLAAALPRDILALVPGKVRDPLLTVLSKANKLGLADFNMEKFLNDVCKENEGCSINELTRPMIYLALSRMGESEANDSDADTRPATEKQRAALKRFRQDPDDFKTAAEASDMLQVLIDRAKKSRSNSSNS